MGRDKEIPIVLRRLISALILTSLVAVLANRHVTGIRGRAG